MAEGRTDFARDPNEHYVEPTSSTEFLLARESFAGQVWDPSCGWGNIVRTCMDAGLDAIGTDLIRRTYGWPAWLWAVEDFLNMPSSLYPAQARNIVMNPPYGAAKTAEAFIRKALTIPRVEKVAAFVSSKFVFGKGRAEGLFIEHPPARVWPIYPRPSCPPGTYLQAGGKQSGGVENFVWVVWDRAAPAGQSLISWAPNEDGCKLAAVGS